MSGRILIVKTSSFGDIVHLFPALSLLRKVLPESEADFLVNPEFAPLLEFSPFPIAEKIIFERKNFGSLRSFLPEVMRLKKELQRNKYDYVIDFQGLFRSGVFTGWANGGVKAGFAVPRERLAAIFYNRKIEVPKLHAVERNIYLVEQLFSLKKSERMILPELPYSSAGAAELPELPEDYIVLLPGARWESKRFPVEVFRGVVENLKKYMPGMKFVAAGSGSEYGLGRSIGKDVVDLAGRTSVAALFELLRKSRAVIGNDSGPLHAAAALNKKVFGFYGPTVPGLTGPYGENCSVITACAECAGCLKRKCPRRDVLCHKLDAAATAEMIAAKLTEV